MTNIKSIGKELLGGSLNTYHKYTGLESVERNNDIQTKILQGIYSQVDDGYLEKTEESNVIHLEGSGDGIVELSEVQGRSLVNLATTKRVSLSTTGSVRISDLGFKNNTTYTLIFNVKSNTTTDTSSSGVYLWGTSNATVASNVSANSLKVGINIFTMITKKEDNNWIFGCRTDLGGIVDIDEILILEGDWTDKEIPPYFEGMKSCFEEKKVGDKYEVEVTSHITKNLYDLKTVNCDWGYPTTPTTPINPNDLYYHCCEFFDVSKLRNKLIYGAMFRDGVLKNNEISFICFFDEDDKRIGDRYTLPSSGYIIPSNAKLMSLMQHCGGNSKSWIDKDKYCISLQPFIRDEKLESYKSNKIKLYLNEPLRGIDDTIRDRLCVIDNKLVVERNTFSVDLTSEKIYGNYAYQQTNLDPIVAFYHSIDKKMKNDIGKVVCDKLPYDLLSIHSRNVVGIASFSRDDQNHNALRFGIHKNTLGLTNDLENKSYINELKTYLINNPMKVIVQSREPFYEEVQNEYGEPVILEGYENGTLYVDSLIVPTTTVKYTQKFRSKNALEDVTKSNITLTSDINNDIISYMMEVDNLIMEKEMSIMTKSNTIKMEVLDMTSMQKRTADMLARLIKGRTLSEQECKDRVALYLEAERITSEQAVELMLLISEVYQ